MTETAKHKRLAENTISLNVIQAILKNLLKV